MLSSRSTALAGRRKTQCSTCVCVWKLGAEEYTPVLIYLHCTGIHIMWLYVFVQYVWHVCIVYASFLM